MTDILTNSESTGDIPPAAEVARRISAETIRLAVGEQTERLQLADQTAIITGAEQTGRMFIPEQLPAEAEPLPPRFGLFLADGYDPGGYPPVPRPVPPVPPRVAPLERVGQWDEVEPGRHRSDHREVRLPKPGQGRHRAEPPLWTRLVILIGVLIMILAGVILLVLAAIR